MDFPKMFAHDETIWAILLIGITVIYNFAIDFIWYVLSSIVSLMGFLIFTETPQL